ncbi:MAG: pentapeptide repeat-containing protein, partial [Deltaproteobacteria bacterium]|nr:pentapeptide repeat-containing protein [Deltaproteobacteria bacterium]
EDYLDDDDMDDDDENYDLPEFGVEDIAQALNNSEKANAERSIVVDGKTVRDLADVICFANESGIRVYVEDSIVNKCRFGVVEVEICCDEVTFTEDVHCNNATFRRKLYFNDTDFGKRIDFSGAVFDAEVTFEDCFFQDEANFTGTTFNDIVSFTSCQFEGQTAFGNARFLGKVDFSNSTFEQKVTFCNATFGGAVDLTNTTFEQGLDGNGSNIEEMRRRPPGHVTTTLKQSPNREVKRKKREFNPWRELDKVSKKNMSRRDLIRGVFRFLPKDKKAD